MRLVNYELAVMFNGRCFPLHLAVNFLHVFRRIRSINRCPQRCLSALHARFRLGRGVDWCQVQFKARLLLLRVAVSLDHLALGQLTLWNVDKIRQMLTQALRSDCTQPASIWIVDCKTERLFVNYYLNGHKCHIHERIWARIAPCSAQTWECARFARPNWARSERPRTKRTRAPIHPCRCPSRDQNR